MPGNGWGAVSHCINYGNVRGTTCAGGIAGAMSGNRNYVDFCENLGIVNSETSGGIVRRSFVWKWEI